MELFTFTYTDTPIHRLDPRSKALLVIVMSILAFIFTSLTTMILLLLLTVPIIIYGHLWSQIKSGFKSITVLLLLILILNSLLNSFNFALIIMLRITVLMIIFSIYFKTTTPEDLVRGLISIKIPYHIAFAVSLSFRFIPTMARETELIMEAQQSRGHKIEKGGILTQIKNFFPLLVPLLMNSIRRAYHVAEALETRGFGIWEIDQNIEKNDNDGPNSITPKIPIPKSRTNYYPLHFKTSDWALVIFSVVLFIVGLLIQYNNTLFPSFLYFNLLI